MQGFWKSWQVHLIGACCLLLPSLVWISLDQRIWEWDASHYADETLLIGQHWPDLQQGLGQFLQAVRYKAPGMVWFGSFFLPLQAFGLSVKTALLISVWSTSVLLLFLLSRLVFSLTRSCSVTSILVLALAGMPLFVGLSHQYLVETFQTLAVTWFVCLLVWSESWPRGKRLIHLGGASALALSAKISTPLYCLVPGIYLLYRVAFPQFEFAWKKRGQPWLSWGEAGSLLLILVTGLWYAQFFGEAWRRGMMSATDSLYGASRPIHEKLLFWLNQWLHASLLVNLGWVALAMVLATWSMKGFSHLETKRIFPSWLLGLALAQMAFTFLSFSTAHNEDPRYLLALTPYLTIVLAYGLGRWNSGPLLIGLGGVFAVQWALVNAQTFGKSPGFCCGIGLTELAHQKELERQLEAVVPWLCQTKPRLLYVIDDLAWFNATSWQFIVTRQAPRMRCQVEGYDQTLDLEASWQRMLGFQPDYILTVAPSLRFATSENSHAQAQEFTARLQALPQFRLSSTSAVMWVFENQEAPAQRLEGWRRPLWED